MPNVTIYMSSKDMPSDETRAQLTEQCTALCTDILQATLKTVHVIYVAAQNGRGHPVFAEVQYRLEPFRTPLVMERFMEELDDAVRRNTGLTARIRCFGYAPPNIHARN